jgi:hypothetical protein
LVANLEGLRLTFKVVSQFKITQTNQLLVLIEKRQPEFRLDRQALSFWVYIVC